jgi:NAD-dependent deacetylase
LEAKPNQVHLFLNELSQNYDVQIITQNIDDLHERAGSKKILHLHGLITMAKSSGPNAEKKYYPINGWEIKSKDFCDDGYPLRPHVVWFGEAVPMMDEAIKICRKADLIIVIGTSLQVYPAAGLIYARKKDCKIIFVDPNLPSTDLNSSEFIHIKGNAVEVIDELNFKIKKAFQ